METSSASSSSSSGQVIAEVSINGTIYRGLADHRPESSSDHQYRVPVCITFHTWRYDFHTGRYDRETHQWQLVVHYIQLYLPPRAAAILVRFNRFAHLGTCPSD